MNTLWRNKNYLFSTFAAVLCFSACTNPPNDLVPSGNYETASELTAKQPNSLEKYFQYQSFTLDNGLRVIVHEDRSTASVSIATLIHVGSKDEPEGRSGFAHLFEHLLFKGTEKNPGEFFKYLTDLGGSNMNAFTSDDLTGYFETVPTGALERVLWLEADRMINTVSQLTQADIETEVDIVKNEKGGSDNQPFGESVYETIQAMYPEGHPYDHSVIGSLEDLEAATLSDVKEWHNKYYGANNTVLAIAGDVDFETVKRLVTKHYAAFPPGEPLIKRTQHPVRRTVNTKHTMHDVAPASQLLRHYNFPPINTPEGNHARIAADILSAGLSSRFGSEIVDRQDLVSYAFGDVSEKELDSTFTIYAEPLDGVSLNQVSEAIETSIQKFIKEGPTQKEINQYIASYKSRLSETVGSTSGKAMLLANSLLFNDDPLWEVYLLNELETVTPEQVRLAAQEWFSEGYHEERLVAKDAFEQEMDLEDIKTPPPVLPTPQKKLFTPTSFDLDTGLEVVHLNRPSTPNVTMTFERRTGHSELSARQEVISGLMQELLRTTGAPNMSKTEYASFKELYGATIYPSINSNITRVVLSVDHENFDAVFPVWRDLIQSPQWSETALEDVKKIRIDTLKKDKKSASAIAMRIMESVFYGPASALSADEEIAIIEDTTLEDLKAFHTGWFQPNGYKIFVSGDIEIETIQDALTRSFGAWSPTPNIIPLSQPDYPAARKRPHFVLIDDPDVTQSYLYALRRAEHNFRDPYKEDIVNTIFGGGFISRLNLNIREDKGWTYGINSDFSIDNTETVWTIQSDVTAEYTVDAIKEVISEIEKIRTTRPVTQKEAEETIKAQSDSFGSSIDNNQAIIKYLGYGDKYAGEYGYYDQYFDRLSAVTLEELRALTPNMINADDLTWIITGDLDVFEFDLRKADLGDIMVYDQFGKRIR